MPPFAGTFRGADFYGEQLAFMLEANDGAGKVYSSENVVVWNEAYYALEENIKKIISHGKDYFSIAANSGKIYKCVELSYGTSFAGKYYVEYDVGSVISDACFSDDKLVMVTEEGVYTVDYLHEKAGMQDLLKETMETMDSGFREVNEELEEVNERLNTREAEAVTENTWKEAGDYDLLGEKVFGNGLYATSKGFYSYDGINWYHGTMIEGKTIAFGNGIFVICTDTGSVYYSIDGKEWTLSSFKIFSSDQGGYYDFKLLYGNGKFVIIRIGNDTLRLAAYPSGATLPIISYYSTDGITWTEGTAVNSTVTLPSGATASGMPGKVEVGVSFYGNGKYYICFERTFLYNDSLGYIMENTQKYMYYSTNGTTWTSISFAETPVAAMYGNGKYVIFDQSSFMYISTNGTSWTKTSYSYGDYTNALFNTNGYTVVGCSYVIDKYYVFTLNIDTGEYVLWESSNTTVWTQSHVFEKSVHKLLYGNEMYICEGDNSYYYRPKYKIDNHQFYFDNLGGRYGFNTGTDRNPEGFIPFSPVISKGALTIEATTDPETFFPLEYNNTYLLFTKEVNISSGAIQGRRIITIDTGRTKSTGIGTIVRTQVNASSASGVTVADYKTEEKFGFSLKPSAVTYEVQYVLMKLM